MGLLSSVVLRYFAMHKNEILSRVTICNLLELIKFLMEFKLEIQLSV